MTVALSSSIPSNLIKNLIVADIAPSRGRLSPDFEMYLQAMRTIEDAKLKTRKEADHMLQEFVKVQSSLRTLPPLLLRALRYAPYIRVPATQDDIDEYVS